MSLAYKFRILSDEADDFLRDVEVRPSQSFLELHEYLVQILELNARELASFSICTSSWNKLSEITLIDMEFGSDEQNAGDEEERSEKRKSALRTYLMSETRLKDLIEDPHQRIIYEFDYYNPKVFYLELIKILEAEPAVSYPRCVKSEGVLPKKLTAAQIAVDEDFDDLGDGLAGDDLSPDFENEVDEGFLSKITEGFEIEEDRSSGTGNEETYDNNTLESSRI